MKRYHRIATHAVALVAGVWMIVTSARVTLAELEQYIALATLLEISIDLRTLWLRDRRRTTLPYWSIRAAEPLGRLVFRYPVLNDLLVGGLLAALGTIAVGYATDAVRFAVLGLFVVLCAIEIPRFLRLHQLIAWCGCFCFASAPRVLLLTLAGIYLYSGGSKLVTPAFYRDCADDACWPIKWLVGRVTSRRGAFYAAVAAVMLGEALLGVGVLFDWWPIVYGIVALHAYIIVFVIFVPREKEPAILGWNVVSAAVAVCALRLAPHAPALFSEGLSSAAWQGAIVAVFLVYPSTMYAGACFAFELSLSYFNGTMFGDVYLVVPRTARDAFPRAVDRHVLRVHEDLGAGTYWEYNGHSAAPSYRDLLALWRERGVSLEQLVIQLGLGEGDPCDVLVRDTFAIDCDWLCSSVCIDRESQYRPLSACYVPRHFWALLVRSVFRTPCVYLRTEHRSYLTRETVRQQLVRP